MNANLSRHRIINGTSYDVRTSDEVVRVLEQSRLNRIRLHISLGDTTTGRDWLEENDVYGYIGRSMGPIKVPLIIANSRSLGGGAILDHCIVRIRISAGGRVLYQHPDYHYGTLSIQLREQAIELPDGRLLSVDVIHNGIVHASFESIEKACRWTDKLGVSAPILL